MLVVLLNINYDDIAFLICNTAHHMLHFVLKIQHDLQIAPFSRKQTIHLIES